MVLGHTNSCTIYGEGGASVIVNTQDGDGVVTLTIGDSKGQTTNFLIKNLTIRNSADNDAFNTGLKVRWLYGSTIENVAISKAAIGIHMESFIHSYVRGCDLRRVNNVNPGGLGSEQGYNILMETLLPTTGAVLKGCSGVHIDDCEFMGRDGSPQNRIFANIFVKHVDGLYITNSHIYQAKYGIYIEPDGAQNNGVTTLMASNLYIDQVTTSHVYFGGKVSGDSSLEHKYYHTFEFSNCFFRDCGDDSFVFKVSNQNERPVENVTLSNCVFQDIGGTAFRNYTDQLGSYSINGCIFDTCGTSGSAAAAIHDYYIRGATINDNVVRRTLNRTYNNDYAFLLAPSGDSKDSYIG